MQPEPGVWEQMADYHAEHQYSHQGNEGTAHLHRGIRLRIENAGSPPETREHGLVFRMRLGPHEERHACLSWIAYIDGEPLPLAAQCSRVDASDWNGMYIRADWPQAWSASAPFPMLQAMLGIYPYASADVLFLDPHLPEWLPEITVEQMRVGRATVTLRFRRNGSGRTEYSIVDLEGPLHLVRQPSPWSLTAGWAERTRDIVESFSPHRKAS